jgi:hypothetical protein
MFETTSQDLLMTLIFNKLAISTKKYLDLSHKDIKAERLFYLDLFGASQTLNEDYRNRKTL